MPTAKQEGKVCNTHGKCLTNLVASGGLHRRGIEQQTGEITHVDPVKDGQSGAGARAQLPVALQVTLRVLSPFSGGTRDTQLT